MKIRNITLAAVMCTVIFISSVFFGIRTYAYDVEEFNATGIVSTNNTSLNVRSGPGTQYEAIESLSKETVVTITGITKDENDNEWYRLDLSGTVGYAMKTYVSLLEMPETPDEEFEASIEKFPESYRSKLRILHTLHPTWKFTPLETGLTWETLMKNECVIGTNLLQTPNAWKSYDDGAYDWENKTWYTFDSGNWAQACTEVIGYYLDPRNFLDGSSVYQFLVLSDDGTEVDPKVINEILKGGFMYDAECDEGLTYAEGIVKAAKEAGASPYMLAARIRLEQGSKGNALAHGYEIDGVKYYNHFDIGAYRHDGNSAIYNGALYAKKKGWDTAYKAILGGAQFLVKSYVAVGQNTLYLQKFDVVDFGNGLYGHQYMTNVSAAVEECKTLRDAIEEAGADKTELNFLIPVYKNMPEERYVLPLRTGNANYLLEGISINGKELQFDKYKFTYEVFTEDTQVEIVATPIDKDAKVEITAIITETEGTEQLTEQSANKIILTEGINEIAVTVTATNGLKREYKLVISTSAEKDFKISYDSTVDRISGVNAETTLADFKAKMELKGYTAKFTDAKGNEKTDEDIMKTGDSVTLYFDETAERTMRIVIYGDSTGDGKLTSADLLKTQKSILGIITIDDEVYSEAADFTKDGKVNSRDLLACQKKILGLS